VTGGVVLWQSGLMTTKAPAKPPGNSPSPWVVHRPDFVDRMKADLTLTDEQATKIANVIRKSRTRTDFLWESLKEPLQEELDQMKKGILAELTPAQQPKFEELIKPKPMKKPGEWGHRRGPSDDKTKSPPPGGNQPPGPPPPGGPPPEPAPSPR
jgi:hypothetical protein